MPCLAKVRSWRKYVQDLVFPLCRAYLWLARIDVSQTSVSHNSLVALFQLHNLRKQFGLWLLFSHCLATLARKIWDVWVNQKVSCESRMAMKQVVSNGFHGSEIYSK